MEVASSGSDYEIAVVTHGDGSIELRVVLVLSRTGRERLHFPRLTPSEAHELAARLSDAATHQDFN